MPDQRHGASARRDEPDELLSREAQPQWRYKTIIAFNDECQSYDTIRALIARARALALADMLRLTRKSTTEAWRAVA
jgi:hypothetical protein